MFRHIQWISSGTSRTVKILSKHMRKDSSNVRDVLRLSFTPKVSLKCVDEYVRLDMMRLSIAKIEIEEQGIENVAIGDLLVVYQSCYFTLFKMSKVPKRSQNTEIQVNILSELIQRCSDKSRNTRQPSVSLLTQIYSKTHSSVSRFDNGVVFSNFERVLLTLLAKSPEIEDFGLKELISGFQNSCRNQKKVETFLISYLEHHKFDITERSLCLLMNFVGERTHFDQETFCNLFSSIVLRLGHGWTDSCIIIFCKYLFKSLKPNQNRFKDTLLIPALIERISSKSDAFLLNQLVILTYLLSRISYSHPQLSLELQNRVLDSPEELSACPFKNISSLLSFCALSPITFDQKFVETVKRIGTEAILLNRGPINEYHLRFFASLCKLGRPDLNLYTLLINRLRKQETFSPKRYYFSLTFEMMKHDPEGMKSFDFSWIKNIVFQDGFDAIPTAELYYLPYQLHRLNLLSEEDTHRIRQLILEREVDYLPTSAIVSLLYMYSQKSFWNGALVFKVVELCKRLDPKSSVVPMLHFYISAYEVFPSIVTESFLLEQFEELVPLLTLHSWELAEQVLDSILRTRISSKKLFSILQRFEECQESPEFQTEWRIPLSRNANNSKFK